MTPNDNNKIMVVVTHGLYEPWLSILRDGQEKTWLKQQVPDNIKIYHFHSTPIGKIGQNLDRLHERIRWKNRYTALALRFFDRTIMFPYKSFIPYSSPSKLLNSIPNALHINFPDSYMHMKWKDLAIIKYFVEKTSCDYLFFTTTSSYVNLNRLKLEVEILPKNDVYAGARAYAGANFAAGNNRLISRDVAIKILENRKEMDVGTIEDVAIGNLMKLLNVKFIELPSLNINSISHLSSISDLELLQNFHFRMKNGLLKDRGDVPIMLALNHRLREIGVLF